MEPWYFQISTGIPNFNILPHFVFEIERGSQNLIWRLLAPCSTPYSETFMCAPSTWQDETVCQVSASSLFTLRNYAKMYSPRRHSIICTQKCYLGFEGEDEKILSSDPQKGNTLRESASDGVSHVKIGSTA